MPGVSLTGLNGLACADAPPIPITLFIISVSTDAVLIQYNAGSSKPFRHEQEQGRACLIQPLL